MWLQTQSTVSVCVGVVVKHHRWNKPCSRTDASMTTSKCAAGRAAPGTHSEGAMKNGAWVLKLLQRSRGGQVSSYRWNVDPWDQLSELRDNVVLLVEFSSEPIGRPREGDAPQGPFHDASRQLRQLRVQHLTITSLTPLSLTLSLQAAQTGPSLRRRTGYSV